MTYKLHVYTKRKREVHTNQNKGFFLISRDFKMNMG